MFDKRGVVPRRRYDNPVDWLIVFSILVALTAGVAFVNWSIKENRKWREEQALKEETFVKSKRECLDYTLREFREGEAPEKCAAEVYGDQF